MLKKILVALDSSELSEQVVQTLKEFALGPEHQVVLVHVLPSVANEIDQPLDIPHATGELELTHHQAMQILQGYQARIPCPSELEVVSGDPAEEIIRLAGIHRSQLIVLGSRGLTGFDRIMQGSVSAQVVADAPCSVLVMKPTA
ncbi:universal stress protein [Leptolyngbya sp. FACHB-261]|uniref:universal stress protein n=1 Tax=Leptolyngbya sp. FACHB-261 TaxID=2692806 RepID=UPI0016871CCC|nr:universal stress protein [Leptolyngbya sp. FACHB-261]MBD2104867.1 universal stress protein [Leptolyngbya sp. FACHB-261]